jgi:predicted enzyme related to lactoylglutathione lyase
MADPLVNSQITDAVTAPEAAAAQRPIGRFVWHDLMTTDPEKAQQYYSDLLGWTYKDFTTPEGTYRMIHAAGTEWGGFMPLDPAHGVPSHWISYVTVADVDATTAKVQELGGQVAVPAMDIPTVGRFAVIASPTGAYVSPFRPESSQGEPPPNPAPGPGAFVWHELLSKDPKEDGEFFSGIFGWRIEEVPMGEMGSYFLFKRLDTGRDAGGMMPKPPGEEGPSAWLPYIQVESADATAARTQELGGTVCVPPMDIPNVGRFTVTTDPMGAFIAFLQP